MNLYTWAARWGIPQMAIDDLRQEMGLASLGGAGKPTGSEASSQQRVRLDAAAAGVMLWRNNVGACEDNNGNHIRYGLANESKKMNENIKSSDLVGITPHLVVASDVGYKIGMFTAREVKAPGWEYKGTKREKAQRKFGELVMANGGDFQFIT